MAEGVAAGLGDVGGVAVVLLRRAHDLRLRRRREPPRTSGRPASGASAGAGPRIPGGIPGAHLLSARGRVSPELRGVRPRVCAVVGSGPPVVGFADTPLLFPLFLSSHLILLMTDALPCDS